MATGEKEIPQSWDRMEQEQLKLYARDLAELYRREKGLRQEVEAKNRELEQRLQELLALNHMFQQHLELRRNTEDAFRKLVDRLHQMVQEADLLLRQVQE